MGKVQIIKKSRKEYKCSKCHSVIPVGSMYYKGEINFGPTIIRCANCKLESWEVTTSDYILSLGPIVYHYADNYEMNVDGIDSIVSDIQAILDETQDRLDNMLESLQYGDTGQLLQDRIDGLESAISDLECIDVTSIEEDILNDYISDLDFEERDADLDEDAFERWEDAEEELKDHGREDDWNELVNNLQAAVAEEVSDALSNIEM